MEGARVAGWVVAARARAAEATVEEATAVGAKEGGTEARRVVGLVGVVVRVGVHVAAVEAT